VFVLSPVAEALELAALFPLWAEAEVVEYEFAPAEFASAIARA
jgi:hypothetical protein